MITLLLRFRRCICELLMAQIDVYQTAIECAFQRWRHCQLLSMGNVVSSGHDFVQREYFLATEMA